MPGRVQVAGVEPIADPPTMAARHQIENRADFLRGAAERGAGAGGVLHPEAGGAGDRIEGARHRRGHALDAQRPIAVGRGAGVEADAADAERRSSAPAP